LNQLRINYWVYLAKWKRSSRFLIAIYFINSESLPNNNWTGFVGKCLIFIINHFFYNWKSSFVYVTILPVGHAADAGSLCVIKRLTCQVQIEFYWFVKVDLGDFWESTRPNRLLLIYLKKSTKSTKLTKSSKSTKSTFMLPLEKQKVHLDFGYSEAPVAPAFQVLTSKMFLTM